MSGSKLQTLYLIKWSMLEKSYSGTEWIKPFVREEINFFPKNKTKDLLLGLWWKIPFKKQS